MRYPLLFLIVAIGAFLVFNAHQQGRNAPRPAVIDRVLAAPETETGKVWLDARVEQLRALEPIQQVMVMATIMVLLVCAACILSYVINSLAAILGMGLSLILFCIAALGVLLAAALGWHSPRYKLFARMKSHAETGPLVRQILARQWRRRMKHAAREHGFASAQYEY